MQDFHSRLSDPKGGEGDVSRINKLSLDPAPYAG